MLLSINVMAIVESLILFLFINESACCDDFEQIKFFLETYGYLDTTETESLSLSSKNFSTLQFGLNKFQEFYNLTITTTLDEATKKLMKSPRCGVADIVSYNVRKTFWKLDVVKWNFPGGTNKQLSVAQAAFNLWEKYGNIKFEHSFANPNIIISFKRRDHLKDTTRQRCPYSFEDDVLGHAFFPLSDNSVAAEVHINIARNWNEDLTLSSSKNSLFLVLAHEIGHAIGIDHSHDQNALMFAYYHQPSSSSPFHFSNYELPIDDQLAVQSLYNVKPSKTTKHPKPTVKSTITTKSSKKRKSFPDLCKIQEHLDTFLIVNEYKYIFYEEYVWIGKIEENKYQEPIIITDWLNFLPTNFQQIDAIYRRPSGEIVFFIKDNVYMMSYPAMKLIDGFPKKQSDFGINAKSKITAAVNSYNGRTFIFYDDNYFLELNECTYTPIKYGYRGKEFEGSPTHISGVFRNTDGFLYFFNKYRYYQYNEFINKLVTVKSNKLEIVNIICPNESILQQLWQLISKLVLIEDKSASL